MASSEKVRLLVFILLLQFLIALRVNLIAFVVQVFDTTLSVDRLLFLVLTMFPILCIERVDFFGGSCPTIPSGCHSLLLIDRTPDVWLAALLRWQFVDRTRFLRCSGGSSLHLRCNSDCIHDC